MSTAFVSTGGWVQAARPRTAILSCAAVAAAPSHRNMVEQSVKQPARIEPQCTRFKAVPSADSVCFKGRPTWNAPSRPTVPPARPEPFRFQASSESVAGPSSLSSAPAAPVVVEIADGSGLMPIACGVEETVTLNDAEYVLLRPVDRTFELFQWEKGVSDPRAEDAQIVAALDIEDPHMDDLFPVAHAAVMEQVGCALLRTALTGTVSGDVPPFSAVDILVVDTEDDYEAENYQILATFTHKKRMFSILLPLVPPMYYARQDDSGVRLLDPTEYRRYGDKLEELFFHKTQA